MMERSYSGPLGDWIDSLVREKKACGYDYSASAGILARFDGFTAEKYPDADTVTRNMAFAWATRLETESAASLRNRVKPVRQLALHMNRMEKAAFVLEMDWFAKAKRPRPRLFSDRDLSLFFEAADRYSACPRHPNRNLVAAALFRTIYCLGLRPCEATRLGIGNVDLTCGAIDVIQSKGDKDRTVLMSPDLLDYLVAYDAEMSVRDPGRAVFFPNWQGGCISIKNIENWFNEIWRSLPASIREDRPRPSLQSFRHTFACKRIALWVDEGRDIRSAIYYLSAHMGHDSFRETEYYLHLMPERFSDLLEKTRSTDEAVIPEVVPHG